MEKLLKLIKDIKLGSKEISVILFSGIVLLISVCVFLPQKREQVGVVVERKKKDEIVMALIKEADDFMATSKYEAALERYTAIYDKYFYFSYDGFKLKDYLFIRIAKLNMLLERYEESLKWYEKARDSDIPGVPADACIDSGMIYSKQGQIDKAIKMWDIAKNICADDEKTQESINKMIGNLLISNQRFREGIEYLKNIKHQDESDMVALAGAYAELGDYYRAYRYYEKAAQSRKVGDDMYIAEIEKYYLLVKENKSEDSEELE